MCELFSFSATPQGKVYAILDERRWELLREGENPDSHSLISKEFGINEDETWKYEIVVKDLPKPIGELGVKEILGLMKYDGGLPEEELPASVLASIQNWLEKNWGKIKENIKKHIRGDWKTTNPLEKILLETTYNWVEEKNYTIKFKNEITIDDITDILYNLDYRKVHGESVEPEKTIHWRYYRDNPKSFVYLHIKNVPMNTITVRTYMSKRLNLDKTKIIDENRVVINGPVEIIEGDENEN